MLTENVVGERVAGSNSLVPLGTLSGLVKASIAAGDKALDKAEQHYKTAGLYLVEARERLPIEQPGKRFTAYVVGECRMQTSRAYELIAIAEGRTTVAEVRAKANERVIKHRATPPDERPLRNGKSPSPDPLSEQRSIVTRAMCDLDLPKMTLLAQYAVELKSGRDAIKEKAKLGRAKREQRAQDAAMAAGVESSIAAGELSDSEISDWRERGVAPPFQISTPCGRPLFIVTPEPKGPQPPPALN